MILELADFHILDGQGPAFAQAVARGVDEIIRHSPGFAGYKLNRGVENPQRYVLQIFWATLEDHTVGFRGSDAFTRWRALVGPYFASPPVVEHFELASRSDV